MNIVLAALTAAVIFGAAGPGPEAKDNLIVPGNAVISETSDFSGEIADHGGLTGLFDGGGYAEVSERPARADSKDSQGNPAVFIEDKSGIFSPEEEASITGRLTEAALSTGWCIGIRTGFPLDSSDNRYSEVFGERDGVMLCINKGVTKVIARGAAAEYVNGVREENIMRLTERCLRKQRVSDIPGEFAGRLEGLKKKGPGSFDLYPPAFAIAVLGAFAAGFGTVFWIGRRYSVNEPPIVNNYLDVRSIEVYRKTDEQIFSKAVRYKNNIIQQMVRGEGIFRRR